MQQHPAGSPENRSTKRNTSGSEALFGGLLLSTSSFTSLHVTSDLPVFFFMLMMEVSTFRATCSSPSTARLAESNFRPLGIVLQTQGISRPRSRIPRSSLSPPGRLLRKLRPFVPEEMHFQFDCLLVQNMLDNSAAKNISIA